MTTFIRNELNNVINVRSIINVFRADLRNSHTVGESHDFPEIFYVEQGQSLVVANGNETVLHAGGLIIYGPNTFHGKEQPYTPGGIVNIICFETESNVMPHLYNRPIKLNPRQRERFEAIVARGQSLFKRTEKDESIRGMHLVPGADLRDVQQLKNLLEVFLLDISMGTDQKDGLTSYSRQEQLYEQQMEHLTTFLMENIDQNLSLKQMEDALWLSESSLRRLVQRCKGCGPVAYFQELKIREAKRLIQTTSLSITEISERLGFSTIHYFSRLFHNKTGMSPTDYSQVVAEKHKK